jgi:hypothetical protein
MPDAGCEGVRGPMFTGGLTRLVQCGTRSAECGMIGNGEPLRLGEEAKFEDFRLKTSFSENVDAKEMKESKMTTRTKTEHAEGWTCSGEGLLQSNGTNGRDGKRYVAEFEVAGVEDLKMENTDKPVFARVCACHFQGGIKNLQAPLINHQRKPDA